MAPAHAPLSLGGTEMSVPGPAAPAQFAYITRMLTSHEEAVTQLGIQTTELSHKLSDIENKQTTDRDLVNELESLRRDVSQAQRRIIRSQDDKSSGTQSLQLNRMQSDVDKMKQQVAELARLQEATASSLEVLVARQLQGMQAVVMSAMQAAVKAAVEAVREEVGLVRSECAAASATAESASLTTTSLAGKLRAHLQACVSLSSKVEGLDKHSGTLASQLSHLEQDSKKVKKHVVKLEHAVDSLQGLGHLAVAADRGVQEVKQGVEEAGSGLRQLQASAEDTGRSLQQLSRQMEQCEQQLGEVNRLASCSRADLGAMAEGMASALQELTQLLPRQPAQPLFQQPSSLLSALLAPSPSTAAFQAHQRVISSHVAAYMGPESKTHPSGPGHQQGQRGDGAMSWDLSRSEFGQFLAQFRSRNCNSFPPTSLQPPPAKQYAGVP
ncbi:hypothetical protein V8C86DRAFT_2774001 [Haematococcus lacustris]